MKAICETAQATTVQGRPDFRDPTERDRDQLVRVVNQGQQTLSMVFSLDVCSVLLSSVVEHGWDIQLANPRHLHHKHKHTDIDSIDRTAYIQEILVLLLLDEIRYHRCYLRDRTVQGSFHNEDLYSQYVCHSFFFLSRKE